MFDNYLLITINPILDLRDLTDIKWKSLEDLDENSLESEFQSEFYTGSKLKLQSQSGPSFQIYKAKNNEYFTLKEVLDAMIHFEKMDRVSSNKSVFFNGLEKTGPDTFRIVWSN